MGSKERRVPPQCWSMREGVSARVHSRFPRSRPGCALPSLPAGTSGLRCRSRLSPSTGHCRPAELAHPPRCRTRTRRTCACRISRRPCACSALGISGRPPRAACRTAGLFGLRVDRHRAREPHHDRRIRYELRSAARCHQRDRIAQPLGPDPFRLGQLAAPDEWLVRT